MKIARLLVRASNSTVNGHRANKNRSAVKSLDGWKDLELTGRRVFKDGKAKSETFFGNGQYLHVPVIDKKNPFDHSSYRVRCRYEPGHKYKGRKIVAVYAKKLRTEEGKQWHWVLETK